MSGSGDLEDPEGGPDDPNDRIGEAFMLGAVGLDGQSTGSYGLNPADDVDMFAFTVTAEQTVGFDVDRVGASTVDTRMRLFNAIGVELFDEAHGRAPDEPAGSEQTLGYFEYTFLNPGTYYLGVSGNQNANYDPIAGDGDVNGGSTGFYSLHLTNRFATFGTAGQGETEDIELHTHNDNRDMVAVRSNMAGDLELTLNGRKLTFLDGRISDLQILTFGGNDVVDLYGIGREDNPNTFEVTINTMAGDDVINFGVGMLRNRFFNPTKVSAGAGDADRINITDAASFIETEYSFSPVTGGTQLILTGENFSGLIIGGTDTSEVHLRGSDGDSVYNLNLDTADFNFKVTGGDGDDEYNLLRRDAGHETFIDGGQGNDFFYMTPADRDLDSFGGTTVIEGGGGEDDLFLNDIQDLGNDTFKLGQFYVEKPGAGGTFERASFTGIRRLHVMAGAGNNYFDVGDGRLSWLAPQTYIDGGVGYDQMRFDDTNDLPSVDIVNVAHNYVQKGNGLLGQVFFENTESTHIDGSPQGTVYNIHSHRDPLLINAGNGNDIFNLTPTVKDLDYIESSIGIQGNGGNDRIVADDEADALDDDYLLSFGATVDQIGTLSKSNGGMPAGTFSSMSFKGIDAFDLIANHDDNNIRVTNAFATSIDAGRGDDLIDVEGNSGATPILLDAGSGADHVRLNDDGGAPISAVFANSQDLAQLFMGDDATLELAAGEDVTVAFSLLSGEGLAEGNGAVIDINDNTLIRLGNANQSFYRDLIARGYDGGTWSGTGIRSSRAGSSAMADGIGFATAEQIGAAHFNGVPVSLNSLIINYTLQGDANLDRRVDLADFVLLRNGFNDPNSLWFDGDFNYDGATDLSDFVLLRGNFNKTV